jgi:tetratricopeptide (TPR) repeat protein
MVLNENWTEAEANFSAITRQANTIAPPWFYLGKAQYKQDETFAAESKFDRALSIYPQYIAPRTFKFKIYLQQEKYNEMLTLANDALETNDIWIFHYYKALALKKLNKLQPAIDELQQACITTNPYNIPQFFLLGDCYKELKKYELAKDAYQKTQSIDIYASEESYNKKMQALEEAMN